MALADPTKLVFAILRFLEDQKTSGSLSDDAVESLEVAVQCLETAYSVSTQKPDDLAKYQVPMNLQDIFSAHLDTQTSSGFSLLDAIEATDGARAEAENWKTKGNDFMKEEKFTEALECYSKSVKLDAKNAVYYCNRAAALSKLQKHKEAIDDCHHALTIDPSYSKAYGRMGIAFTALNEHADAHECYRKAIELDPDNETYKNNLEIAEQKLREEALRQGAGAFPGMGGMDMSWLLNNRQLMNMATTMMSNPQMQQMMSNVMQEMNDPNAGAVEQPTGEGTPAVGSLLQIGEQLAAQMQAQNPDLVNQMRECFQRQGPESGTDGNGEEQPPEDNSGQTQ